MSPPYSLVEGDQLPRWRRWIEYRLHGAIRRHPQGTGFRPGLRIRDFCYRMAIHGQSRGHGAQGGRCDRHPRILPALMSTTGCGPAGVPVARLARHRRGRTDSITGRLAMLSCPGVSLSGREHGRWITDYKHLQSAKYSPGPTSSSPHPCTLPKSSTM